MKTQFPPLNSDFPGDFPVIAMPPTDHRPNNRLYLFYGLISACVAVAISLLVWKMMAKPKYVPPPPAPPAMEIRTNGDAAP